MAVIKVPPAPWPLSLSKDLSAADVEGISRHVDELAESAQYGWGHTIDFGPFTKRGLMGYGYLRIAGALDAWGWWPKDLTGLQVADIGCFTGGLSVYLAARNPSRLYAVDELDDHLDQCAYLAEVFGLDNVETIGASLYGLDQHVAPGSLNLILLSGVLYHLSDMLVGLHMMRHLLAPGGVLVLETNAVENDEHSYANFGRYFKGMWWQPSSLCLVDMCEFMGFTDVQLRFYDQGRALVRCVRAEGEIPFKRGMNWSFASLRDSVERTEDETIMAPVPERATTTPPSPSTRSARPAAASTPTAGLAARSARAAKRTAMRIRRRLRS